MSLPAYAEYKKTGFIWVDLAPSHWPLNRLGDICSFEQGKAHEPFIDPDGEYICVNSRFVSTEGASRKFCLKNLTPVKMHDILMVMSDLPNGRALAKAYFVQDDRPYAVNQRVCRISAKSNASAKFLFYLLNRHPDLMMCDDGVNQTHLSNSDYLKLKIYLPSLPEQTTIARFLDHETAKIDSLIAEQQRLIELLKEKRQAVISHAVTKGLDPNAPMKDSGVAWLGDVPEHWEVMALKWKARIKSGDGISPNDISHDLASEINIPVFGGNGIMGYTNKKNIENKCIVIGRVGALCGNVHKIEDHVWVSDNALVLDFKDDFFYINYLTFFLYSRNLNDLADKSAQPLITGGKVLNQMITCPSMTEQTQISKFIECETAKIDELISHAHQGIDLLKERRSALISAAVTGKIDVRGWQPPATAATTPQGQQQTLFDD